MIPITGSTTAFPPKPPRPAPVCRQGQNTVDLRTVPIIVIPGVMGSRLDFPEIDQQWDPDSWWAMTHWAWAGAKSMRTQLHHEASANVMTTGNKLSDSELEKGWAGVASKYYVEALRFLANAPFPAYCPVYAFGYDWRQSNEVSGSDLAAIVPEILEQEDADQVILVTHSMGGIVARSALKSDSGLAGKVLGVVHVVQPVDGAPVIYRRFFSGGTWASDGFAMMLLLHGSDRYTASMSGMPGPLELLPTNAYRDPDGAAWLRYRDGTGTQPCPGDVYDLYNGSQCPPGLITSDSTRDSWAQAMRQDLQAHVKEVKSFHQNLERFKHDKTYAIFGSGVNTDVGALFDRTKAAAPGNARVAVTGLTTLEPSVQHRGVEPQQIEAGDGSVPASSGSALFPGKCSTTAPRPDCPQYQVNGVDHSGALSDGNVQNMVADLIGFLLQGGK